MWKVDYGEILKIVDVPKEYRPTHATSLLIRFAKPKRDQRRIVDLGCGAGISSIMIAKIYGVEVLGMDIDSRAIEIGEYLVKKVEVGDKVKFLLLDVGDVPNLKELREKFDLVVSNPPHHFEGKISPNPLRESVRRSSIDLMKDFVIASFHLLKNRGEFLVVSSPERLPDLIQIMKDSRMEPKVMIPVYGRRGKNCELVVLRGRKNGRPGFSVEEPIFLSEEMG